MRALFRQFWPGLSGKRAVYAGYSVLRSHPALLADIALRNCVYADAPPAANVHAAGVIEGRRQCALEIIRLAKLHPDALWDVIEARTSDEKRNQSGSRT